MTARPTIAVLNGPNLNLLGTREPHLYGTTTLADIEKSCRRTADDLGFDIDFRQSNHEGALIDTVHELRESAAGFVVNAAAYTHTSVALHDALVTVAAPIVEVHLTNVHAREEFRHRSFVAPVATAVIAGCGPDGYGFAVRHLAALALDTEKKESSR
ncbi:MULTISPECIES: type II 3-dehydroquinate dehydratase [Rhodococcus]|uniref:3-dehydroquinate dehydratase n=1 Tax=Rhodococcus rhodochrous J45 TaxID=935266 RepID=A0A562D964_RHORH|nr:MULTISPECIES: type II 3-dehydroquinate dehydratase [Rhodococcus]MXQ77831.1 type II 3-dehydroquinate dehydratase [Rhodococcus rhodochrous]OWY82981.1 type II 3-dehydroquinate dehydratase [Rhodococcus sp. BUPNP1]TWH06156.1 3-dehydroquinate dehydratase [Rhodococcus rhodochrous J45]WSE21672.1 type II 3-dehydroquinate dehydratase [Rhodococcus sp. PD04]